MIKFFRKIRHKLLTENRFSKYLLYAIGEIALVMIGILLALQVNNWNEKRKTLKSEKTLLTNFIKELDSDVLVFKNHQRAFDRINSLHMNLYLIGVEEKESIDIEDPGAIRSIQPFGILSEDNYPNIVSEISNRNVSNTIKQYFTSLETYEGTHQEIVELIRDKVRPYLGAEFIYDVNEWYSHQDDELRQSKFVSKERLLKLSKQPEFQQLIIQVNLKVVSMKRRSERLIEYQSEVKQTLLSELNKY